MLILSQFHFLSSIIADPLILCCTQIRGYLIGSNFEDPGAVLKSRYLLETMIRPAPHSRMPEVPPTDVARPL